MPLTKKPRGGVSIVTPATYRIRVQSILDQSCSDELGGMTISVSGTGGAGPPVTTLVGSLVDQAALMGVLNALYDLRMPLLSVENLDEAHQRAEEN